MKIDVETKYGKVLVDWGPSMFPNPEIKAWLIRSIEKQMPALGEKYRDEYVAVKGEVVPENLDGWIAKAIAYSWDKSQPLHKVAKR